MTKILSDRTGLWPIMERTVLQIVRQPVCWIGFLLLPLFLFLFFGSLMEQGLPVKVPAAIVDRDGTQLSRQVTQTLGGMQMVDLKATPESYTQARQLMQEGKIYGYFLIPENYQAELLAGRTPTITFYTNMTYYVPASLLFKTFKTTALYSKAGLALSIIDSAGGASMGDPTALLNPVGVVTRGIGNPWLNYGIYLSNSFLPCSLQLMILLMTCYTLGQEIKYRTSRRLLHMARGSMVRAVAGKLLPQTGLWWIPRGVAVQIQPLPDARLMVVDHSLAADVRTCLPGIRTLHILRAPQPTAFALGVGPARHPFLLDCSLLLPHGEHVRRHEHILLDCAYPLQFPDIHRPGSQRPRHLLFARVVCGLYRVHAAAPHHALERKEGLQEDGIRSVKRLSP